MMPADTPEATQVIYMAICCVKTVGLDSLHHADNLLQHKFLVLYIDAVDFTFLLKVNHVQNVNLPDI